MNANDKTSLSQTLALGMFDTNFFIGLSIMIKELNEEKLSCDHCNGPFFLISFGRKENHNTLAINSTSTHI